MVMASRCYEEDVASSSSGDLFRVYLPTGVCDVAVAGLRTQPFHSWEGELVL